MVLASLLSQSKYLFLSGVITALPILTLINMWLQMKNMEEGTFHLVQKNTVFGAIGLVLFTTLVLTFTNWFKPGVAVLAALCIYAVYMVGGKFVLSALS